MGPRLPSNGMAAGGADHADAVVQGVALQPPIGVPDCGLDVLNERQTTSASWQQQQQQQQQKHCAKRQSLTVVAIQCLPRKECSLARAFLCPHAQLLRDIVEWKPHVVVSHHRYPASPSGHSSDPRHFHTFRSKVQVSHKLPHVFRPSTTSCNPPHEPNSQAVHASSGKWRPCRSAPTSARPSLFGRCP